jgi:hypothetical protein
MIGGYIQPGNPVANMFFSLYVSPGHCFT